MALSNTRRQRTPMVFEPDLRPGADAHVYCKGCGEPLEGELRRQQARNVVAVMMCEACREIHGHELIPASGAPSFCYRCGERDEIFVERSPGSPIVHHVCPRCFPDRASRFRTGNFEEQEPDSPA